MKELTYGSVCSGIEAVSVAWDGLNLKPIWFSEIEPFPCAVLSHHYPTIPNHGDITTLPERILSGEIEAPDILVGGTPCQAFSVAGLRNSLDDERGNLTLVFVRILNAINTIRRRSELPDAIALWENVPGVLSTRDNAFGCFLAALLGEAKELVPTGSRWTGAGIVRSDEREIAWRILDAQYFGVPQRRRRVFVIASAGCLRPAEILFERQSQAGHPAAGAEAGQNPAAAAPAGSHWDDPTNPHPTLNQSGSGGIIGQSNQEIFSQRGGGLIPVRMRGFGDYVQDNTVSTVKARDHKDATDLIVVNGRQAPCVSDKAFTLDCQHNGNTNVVCIHGNTIGRQLHNGGNGTGTIQDGTSYTLTATDSHAVSDGLQLRRLTPTECERLQGFPDNHTLIPWRGKPAADCPDSPRYKAIGNSMAVPVIRWIGERICRI